MGYGAPGPQRHHVSCFKSSSPSFHTLSFMSPVAASKSGLSKTPSRKKKNCRGPVIKITEMSEKYLSQESEASE